MSFDCLFDPMKIGSLELKNRFMMAPMASNLGNEDATPSEKMIAYYRERAKGGFGLIIVEATSVHPTAKGMMRQAGIYADSSIPAWKKLTDAIHEEGGKACVEIYHGGRQVRQQLIGEVSWAPSAVSCPRYGWLPRALSTEECWNVVELFGDAALRAKKAGFDTVEVHSSAGYLLAEFLSAHANKRIDEFGGDLEGRTRIHREIIKNIRKKCGEDFPVMIRIGSDEHVIDGIVPHEAAAIAMILEEAGYDCIDLAQCVYETKEWTTPIPLMVRPGWSGYASEEVKKAVKHIPIASSGRYVDPYVMEAAVRTSKVDFINLGRVSIADAYIPNKIREGRINEISPCIGCNQSCIGYLMQDKSVSCLVNPMAGHETIKIEPAKQKKTIAVIGGGVAGLYFAMMASGRGHEVHVYEKDEMLGGQFRLAGIPEGKQDIERALRYYIIMGKKNGVQYHTGCEITPESIRDLKEDTIVIATGSNPLRLPIKGMNTAGAVDAVDVLGAKCNPGVLKKILVVGGGNTGAETAVFLSERRNDVTIVEMQKGVALECTEMVRKVLLEHLESRGTKMVCDAKVTEFFPDGVSYVTSDGKAGSLRGFDSVVLAMGVRSRNPFKEEMDSLGKEIYVIGDAVKAGQANAANESARDLALVI